MKILIVKLGALGDVIRTSYFLKSTKKRYLNPEIYWLTSINSLILLKHNPFVFLTTHKINDLINIEFDWIISLDDDYNILKKLKKLKFKKITGSFLGDSNKINYTDDSSLWYDMSLISKYGKERADQLKKKNKLSHNEIFSMILDINNIKPFFYNPYIPNIVSSIQFHKKYFHIGINSSAGVRWPSKSMRVEEVIKLIEVLTKKCINDKKIFIHLLGSKKELRRNKIILKHFNDKKVDILDTSESIFKFATVIKLCNYVITSDSLALHLAIAQRVLNLSFFAPTSAAEIDTFGTGVKVISTSKDYCNYSARCDNSTITALRVYNAFQKHIYKLKSATIEK